MADQNAGTVDGPSTAAARPATPEREESDEHQQQVVVTVPPLDKTVFDTWNEFHEYLAEYQQRTFQVYSIRTATPVSTRNKRITERYTRRGLAVPPGELLPDEMVTYSKAVVCTHHGRPRSRATGVRARQPSRAINCPAQITLVLRRDYTSGKCLVHVSSHTTRHNHALSDGLYRRHPMVRRVTDPNVLRTVHTLQKANVEPAKILKYVREHTDKDVSLRDVHNMLAQLRKRDPPTPEASAAVPAPSAAALVTVAAAPQAFPAQAQASPPPAQPPHFTLRKARAQSAISRREFPTQYGKFLAAFDVGKEIAELMAEMDADRFAHCFAELRMFLRTSESGRVPVVSTRETVEQTQSNVALANTQHQAFQSSPGTAPQATTSSAAANSLISPSQPYSSNQ